MSKVEVKTNWTGLGELRSSQWAADLCNELADEMIARAGEGYEKRQHYTTGPKARVIVNVYADTEEAYQDNLDNNTLLKALGG